ncbi:HK97 gp10 family phage protein [Streptomyces synnematoformans]|uniref:HK97 gp10 family phage protein n=1 Tax=Streptomyces synnematoformans TaxID=415721 RepID=A0ABN2XB08_9ACTN
MAARYRPNRKGVGHLLRSPMIRADLVRRAELVKAAGIAIAPVYEGPGNAVRGLYKASFEVSSTSRGGRNRDRAVAYVRNTAPYARFVEYGTERVPAHHVMLRAAQAAAD